MEIQSTGLRAGEKLLEEIQFDGEDRSAASHDKIRLLKSPAASIERIDDWLDVLPQVIENRDANAAGQLL